MERRRGPDRLTDTWAASVQEHLLNNATVRAYHESVRRGALIDEVFPHLVNDLVRRSAELEQQLIRILERRPEPYSFRLQDLSQIRRP